MQRTQLRKERLKKIQDFFSQLLKLCKFHPTAIMICAFIKYLSLELFFLTR